MSGHTPGPWAIEEVWAVGRGQESGMADICVMDSDGEGYTMIARVNFVDPQEKADARLMAAAPDLLAALESFPGFLCGCGTGDAWIERMRAAITKARGDL